MLYPRSTQVPNQENYWLLILETALQYKLLASKSMGKKFWMAFTSHGCGLQSSVALRLRALAQPTSTKIFMVPVPIWKPILSNCYSDKTFWSGTVSAIQHFSPIQYSVLVHSTVDMGNFTQLFSSPLHAQYFVQVSQMNSVCSTDYSSHMHFPSNAHDSTHAWVPISHSSTGSMTSVWAHFLKQTNTGFFYAQEHRGTVCTMVNGMACISGGYRVRITTTDLTILSNVYILNSLSNNAASYNMLWTLPFKFPTTHYS